MNHSVNRSVNHSRRMSCAIQCPIHWGKGRDGNGRENSQKTWLRMHGIASYPKAQIRDDAMQVSR